MPLSRAAACGDWQAGMNVEVSKVRGTGIGEMAFRNGHANRLPDTSRRGKCEMETLGWRDLLVHQERYKDMLREAESRRLIRQARAEMPQRPPMRYRALGWLGRQLVNWGCRLEERYRAAAEPSPQPSVANCGGGMLVGQGEV